MTVNSVRSLLENSALRYADKTALIQDQKSLSYKELFEKVNKVANYFISLNLPKGSRIGIYSDKRVGQVISILALLSTPYVFVPISRLLKPEQVEYIAKDCDLKCIITDSTKVDAIKEIDFDFDIVSFEYIDDKIVSFTEIYKFYKSELECDVNSHDNAAITYSFGLSGSPKGVIITHRAFLDGARVVCKYLDIKHQDVISGILSFNFDYGLNQIFCALLKGATLAMHKFVLPNEFFSHLINDQVTILPLMPINITQMFDEDVHRLPSPEILSNIRIVTSSGGKITPLMIKNISTYFSNAHFYSMHGLDEAFRSAYLDPKQLGIRPTSIGKAIPDVELYVINEEGFECKPREVGELIHRGACIYKGYWNAPKETKERFKSIEILKNAIDIECEPKHEIVLASGDLVYKDEEGYIYFVSRKDDMIKTRGFRVNPLEIQSVVENYLPEVKKCIVFSIENEQIEEEIVLVYSASKEIAKNEITFELKKHLPNYMIPTIIVYKKLLSLEIDKEALKKEIIDL